MKRVLALILSVLVLLFAASCGEPEAAPEASLSIIISSLTGTARTLRGDGTAESLSVGSELFLGDSIITDRESTVDLSVETMETAITVSPSSEIVFNNVTNKDGDNSIVIVVRKGSISNSVDVKLDEGDIYEVCTGDMTMAIRGTDAYVDYSDGGTRVSLLTGYALVFDYAEGLVYIVPAGIEGIFGEEDMPVFRKIDVESFGAVSDAAEAMLERVKADNPDFADDFETELRDSYISDKSYTFSVTVPLTESEAEALYDEETSVTEQEEVVTEPLAEEPAEEQTAAAETTTAATTTKAVTTAKSTVVSTSATPTAPTTASTAATTASTAATTVSTAATTVSTAATTASTAATTASTAETTASTAATTASTAATTASTAATTASTTTTTTTTAATTTTTTTTTSAATGYTVSFLGLYLDSAGVTQTITTDTIYSAEAEEGVYKKLSCTVNGATLIFDFTWNEGSSENYDGSSYSARLYVSNSTDSAYDGAYTFVYAAKNAD